MGHAKTLLPITAHNIAVIALPIKRHKETTGEKSDFLKQVSLGSNVHFLSSFMLEFISKHTLIPVHRNINILGLRRLNITFLTVFYLSLQGFGWTGPAKLLVKLLTWSEIVAFRLSEVNSTTVQTTVLFFFYSEKKKKSLYKIFLTVKNHQGGINYWWMFFLLSTAHYFWTFSVRRGFFLVFERKH